jgi:hypothetical protein
LYIYNDDIQKKFENSVEIDDGDVELNMMLELSYDVFDGKHFENMDTCFVVILMPLRCNTKTMIDR